MIRKVPVAVALMAAVLGLVLYCTPAKSQEIFINPFFGATVFDTTVDLGTQRAPDQGGDALTGGIRLGINNTAPFFYGAELEAFGANGRSRLMLNNGLTYTYDLNWGAGAYARIGWRTRGNTIAFFRAGVLATNNDTRVDLGVGAEVPVADNVAIRIDLGYSPGNVEYYRLTGGVVMRFNWR